MVQEDVQIGAEGVRVRVVAVLPASFPADTKRRLEDLIRTRTGRQADVVIYDVATREDLSALTGRLSARTGPIIQTLDEMRAALLSRMSSSISAAWPTGQAPLLNYNVTLDSNQPAPIIDLTFLSDQDLGPLGEAAIRKGLGDSLAAPSLEVRFNRVPASWTVHYRAGSSALSQAETELVDKVAAVLTKFPKTECTITLAAETSGNSKSLSALRLQKLQEYLVQKAHISAGQLYRKQDGKAANGVTLSLRPGN
ncbi:MAG: hypothetical protein ACRD5M_07410 [Candidatus Acidiferrales bacterium]